MPEVNDLRKYVHARMMYECKGCLARIPMYLELGVEEVCNKNLLEKSGREHKVTPCYMRCPECEQVTAHDTGATIWFARSREAKEGCNLFQYDAEKEYAQPVFCWITLFSNGDSVKCCRCGDSFTVDDLRDFRQMGEAYHRGDTDKGFFCPDCWDTFQWLAPEEQLEFLLKGERNHVEGNQG